MYKEYKITAHANKRMDERGIKTPIEEVLKLGVWHLWSARKYIFKVYYKNLVAVVLGNKVITIYVMDEEGCLK